jgi:nicotinamidase-related amidase
MSHSALLVIDVQSSFFHRDYWCEDHFPAFKEAVSQLIAGCEARNVPVINVLHADGDGPFDLASGLVTPMPFLQHVPDVTFYKRVHNALTESGLQHWLQQQNITQLIVCGIRTEQCCETTARVAADLGYEVIFVTEATLTFPMTHNGITLSVADLFHRTETVLNGRFATIHTVESCLQALSSS